MACSICGSKKHNARTCPKQPRDRTVIARFDGMTKSEADKMEKGLQSLKKKHTADSVRGTLVSGKSWELPSKIKNLIGFSKDKS